MKIDLVHVGVVVIGRNEGERLKRCLASIPSQVGEIVYVDSGSSDNSVAHAESIGVEVVQLDMHTPFSAGRARNEGFRRLIGKNPIVEYIQFIDGDCELSEGWLDSALVFMEKNSTYAIVAGRRKERFPENSIYNFLCDLEWNTPVGRAKSCGGDFMARKNPFLNVNGFNPTVVAGEEPELCYRLRRKQWQIYRIDHLMTLHDADITHFSQWWKRMVRSGHAFAHGYTLHGSGNDKYCLRDSSRIWFWALILPAFVLLLAFLADIRFLLLFSVYVAQLVKIMLNLKKRVGKLRHSFLYAFYTIIGKWPQLMGQLLFLKRKLLGDMYSIIEYN